MSTFLLSPSSLYGSGNPTSAGGKACVGDAGLADMDAVAGALAGFVEALVAAEAFFTTDFRATEAVGGGLAPATGGGD